LCRSKLVKGVDIEDDVNQCVKYNLNHHRGAGGNWPLYSKDPRNPKYDANILTTYSGVELIELDNLVGQSILSLDGVQFDHCRGALIRDLSCDDMGSIWGVSNLNSQVTPDVREWTLVENITPRNCSHLIY